MDSRAIDEMEERIAALERSLAAARTEIGALRDTARKTKRARGAVVCLSAALAVGVASFGRWSEAYAQGQTFTTPFTILNQAGHKVLQVREDSDANYMVLYDKQERAVAAMTHSQLGGILTAADTSGNPRLVIGVESSGAGALIAYDKKGNRFADILETENGGRGFGVYDTSSREKLIVFVQKNGDPELLLKAGPEQRSVMLLGGDGSNLVNVYDGASKPLVTMGQETHQENSPDGGPPVDAKVNGVVVFGEQGTPIAKLFLNKNGNGSMAALDSKDPKHVVAVGVGAGSIGPGIAMDDGGITRAVLALVDRKPVLDLKSDAGTPIIEITQGVNGGGTLQLGDPAGNAMVEAGVTESGRGLVRTYPLGNPGAGLIGMPGTFIIGREKGGQ